MYTRIGGRYTNLLAWAALLLLLALGVTATLMMRSIYPMLVVLVPIALWVLAAAIIYVPVFVLKVYCDIRSRSHRTNA